MTVVRLHNTLSRQLEDVSPLTPGHVRMYVCGPTVYDRAHIGNARPAVIFDVLARVLRHVHGQVTYARNITDVEDKIMARALERGIAISDLTAETTALYHQDMAAIGVAPPDIEPFATAHIPHMIALIGRLIDRDHAYLADGHVLFHVPSFPAYGRLSGRDRDEQIAGARVEVAPYKRDPADFVLWKPSAADQVGWDSPWGRGRPGWHIECSAMAEAHLGLPFDIHGGGIDLVFPHHENEIAQSCAAHGSADYARLWVHNGFLMVNGEKMSKSLGNFFTVADLLDRIKGEALRLTLLSAQYRQPLDFTFDRADQMATVLDRLYGALRGVAIVASQPDPAVLAALADDLNTPLAIARLHDLAGEVHRADQAAAKALAAGVLKASAALLGLLQQDPEVWFKGDDVDAALIEQLIVDRMAARKVRDFAKADQIRRQLDDMGVVIEDGPAGTTWRKR